ALNGCFTATTEGFSSFKRSFRGLKAWKKLARVEQKAPALQSQRPGAGLFNVGNSCYINVILQCLTYTPPLANYLLSSKHSQACQHQGFCMMCTMEAHVRKFFLFVFPSSSGRQGSAYEFLRCTVSAMHRACLSGSSDLGVSSQQTTIVDQIFGGFMKYTGHSQITSLSILIFLPAFLDVSFDIRVTSGCVRQEKGCVAFLGKSGAFQHLAVCLVSRCKKKAAASENATVHRAPRVLTLCLERADQQNGAKISKFVEYPEYLDLRPYMSDTAGEPLLYSLCAIMVHSGDTCLEGHFLCYTKASNGLWYKMDDDYVENCDIHTVLGQQAYLLFYTR
uniref:USP domain-containing protein n=1 Tax=Catharus ustulatus TaxID=91951 RepID=A0A8C3V5P0_CATUS